MRAFSPFAAPAPSRKMPMLPRDAVAPTKTFYAADHGAPHGDVGFTAFARLYGELTPNAMLLVGVLPSATATMTLPRICYGHGCSCLMLR